MSSSSYLVASLGFSIELAKKLVGFFHKMVQENLNKLFGQTNVHIAAMKLKDTYSLEGKL